MLGLPWKQVVCDGGRNSGLGGRNRCSVPGTYKSFNLFLTLRLHLYWMDTYIQGHGYVSKAITVEGIVHCRGTEKVLWKFKGGGLYPIWRLKEGWLKEMTFELALKSWLRVGLDKAITTICKRLTVCQALHSALFKYYLLWASQSSEG